MSTENRNLMAVASHVLLCDHTGRTLFIRRANTGYADGHWSTPGGHVDAGETLSAAAVRETAEEIGVRLDECEVECLLVQHKHDLDGEERIDVFFGATLPEGQVPRIAEPDKCDGMVWAAPASAPEPLVPYVAAALAAIDRRPRRLLNYFGFEGDAAADKAEGYHRPGQTSYGELPPAIA